MFRDRKIQYKILNINHRNQMLHYESHFHWFLTKYQRFSESLELQTVQYL